MNHVPTPRTRPRSRLSHADPAFGVPTSRSVGIVAIICTILACASPAWAWDAHGHRFITLLALDAVSNDAPAFLRDPELRRRIADNAVEPDRWRGVRLGSLANVSNPDHYLDVEDLDAYGLTLATVPSMRNEFIAHMAVAREKAGAQFKGRPVNPATDSSKTAMWPGFVAHAIAENYGKLIGSFRTIRMLDRLNDPARDHQRRAAESNAATHLGILSHFVADCAQPLHTTTHHHGWIGDNPEGYTTDRGIHAYIDGTILAIHGFSYDSLKDAPGDTATQPRIVEPMNPWPAIIAHVERSHAQVIPLYEMKKSGDLEREPGKEMIRSRVLDGASMLAALINAAWIAAEPTDSDVENFVRYDDTPAP
jgi:hypothetical protein